MSKRLHEGWLLTGWQAHPEGVTDVAVGNYDVPGAWHVWLKRNERGEAVIHTPAYRISDEGRVKEPESNVFRRDEIHEYVLAFAREGRINISQWENRRGKKDPQSGAGDRQAVEAVPGVAGPGSLLGAEPGV